MEGAKNFLRRKGCFNLFFFKRGGGKHTSKNSFRKVQAIYWDILKGGLYKFFPPKFFSIQNGEVGAACKREGIVFLPLQVENLGGWHETAVQGNSALLLNRSPNFPENHIDGSE